MKLTKEWLERKRACESGIEWFNRLGKTELLDVGLAAIDDNLVGYAKWLIRNVCSNNKKLSVEVAIFAAEKVLHIFEKKYPRDKRPRNAIEAAKGWLNNPSEENRLAADEAASAAVSAAWDADAATWAAVRAAEAAAASARAASSSDGTWAAHTTSFAWFVTAEAAAKQKTQKQIFRYLCKRVAVYEGKEVAE